MKRTLGVLITSDINQDLSNARRAGVCVTIRAVRTVAVNLSGHAYAVSIEPGLLSQAGAVLRSLSAGGKAFVVTDTNVAPLYLDEVTRTMKADDFAVAAHSIPA